jgi:hypothetical protein
MGNSSNTPTDFTPLFCPVCHTQSVHKHKYYYYNLHNFTPYFALSATHSQYTNTNIITTIYTIFPHILPCLPHTFSTQTQIILMQFTKFLPAIHCNFHYIFPAFIWKKILTSAHINHMNLYFLCTISEYKDIVSVTFVSLIYIF